MNPDKKMSKTKLFLTEEGIAYIHDKRFGNPKEIRIRLCSSELNFILRLDNETHHLRR